MSAPRQPRPLPPAAVRAVAAALFVGTVAILLATLDMGYTRDESFYFRYAMSYQDWFVELERAEQPADVERVFAREAVIRTWLGNFEHPPLMKSLFGFSWRALAVKYRRVPRVWADGAGARFRVEAGPAAGFDEGATVSLLAPMVTGQAVSDAAREVATGTVVERHSRHAIVLAVGADADALQTVCAPQAGEVAPASTPQAPVRYVTGCQAREQRALALLSEATAMRLPAILFAALAVVFTFLLGVELFGWLPGLLGAAAFLFVPRHFFHAHLTAFDMPIVAAQLMTLYAFWRSLRDRRWALAAGLMWGVALLTKHNAFFLPVALLSWWIWTGRDQLRVARRGWRVDLRLPRLPLALLVMPALALPMLFSFWPKLWYDPMRAVRDYFNFHLSHEHYMQWYFGEPLQVPPFPVELPFTLTGITVPEVFLLLTVVGLFAMRPTVGWRAWWANLRALRPVGRREKALAFALFNGLIPILVIAAPSTPIFGGIKHWMTGMPFVLLIAGYGLSRVMMALPARAVLAPALALVVFAQPVGASIESTPFGTGYYSSLLGGGIQGAADRQSMRMYWGHTSLQVLEWLNANAPRRARVFFQNTTWDAFTMYQRMGLLRQDVRYSDTPGASQLALIEPQKAFSELDRDVRRAYGVAGPAREVSWRGVPFLKVYVRPQAIERAAAEVAPGERGRAAAAAPPLPRKPDRAPPAEPEGPATPPEAAPAAGLPREPARSPSPRPAPAPARR